MARRTTSTTATVFTLLCLPLALPVSAQIPTDYPVVGITAPDECAGAPQVWDASSFELLPGTYDFWIYPLLERGFGVDQVRFGLDWSPGWQPLDIEYCYGEVVSGGISVRGDHVTLALEPGLSDARPYIRLRIDASTKGRLDIIDIPTWGEAGYRVEGIWQPFSFRPWAWVGDYAPCTDALHPIDNAADVCDLFLLRNPGSLLLPPITVVSGSVLVSTLVANTTVCAITPECGSPPYGTPCLDGFRTDVPWMYFEAPELPIGGGDFDVVMTVDATELGPGSYPVHIEGGQNCVACGLVCYDIEVVVDAVPVGSSSWGRIKATYTDGAR